MLNQKFLVALLLSIASLAVCADELENLRAQAKAIHGTLPTSMPGAENDSPALIELGERLYFETALSKDGTQSCNSCHRIDSGLGGVDNEVTSLGVAGQRGDRNSPTVWNAGFHVSQFWDGRAKDLKEQAKGPILNPIEMAVPDEATAVANLKAEGYQPLFKKAFPGSGSPLTYDNIAHAIGAFERTLITQDRFDAFLNGDDSALTLEEQEGYRVFVQSGCSACHNGPLFGGNMFMKMGAIHAYENKEDKGKFTVTGNPADMFVFKVPSLRNISKTAPYFHDGKAATLEEAVSQMAWLQLNRKLSVEEVEDIVQFLGALDNTKSVDFAFSTTASE